MALRRARSAGVLMPAFADDDALARHQRREPLAGRQRGLEGAQVAVVDADQPRLQLQGALQFILLMNFDQNIHPIGKRRTFDLGGGPVIDRRHDDQDAVGAQRPRFDHLIGLVDEVLAQRRQAGGVARLAEELRPALERRRVGQHRQTGGAARLISLGQRRRIEIGADQSLRRARLLDLGDQRVVAGRHLALDRLQEAARRAPPPSPPPPARSAAARAWPPRSPRACRLRSW